MSLMRMLNTWQKHTVIVVGAVIAMSILCYSPKAEAASTSLSAQGKVSFTFDDGYKSALTKAAPTLNESGISGTSYVTTNFIGSSAEYMTWADVAQLSTTYGWEIGGHSVTHPLSTQITPQQIELEAANCKQTLIQHGFTPTSYATPFGDYNGQVIEAIARHYTSHRPFHDKGYNVWPYSDYLLQVQQVQSGVSVQTVKSYVDSAKQNNTWLILVFHDIKDVPSSDPQDYEYSTNDLRSIAQYVKSLNMPTPNVTAGLVNNDTNLLPNSTFNQGQAGWTTDAPSNVSVNTQSKGSSPDATNSLAVTSTTQNIHIHSDQVSVKPTETYVLKGFLNASTIQGGEVAFYIDEYNLSGSWISGIYLGAVTNDYTKSLNVAYKPSSVGVYTSSLQVIITANSNAKLYIDNVRWFSTSANSPTPPPAPPAPSPNLLPNASFDAGITQGWTTDSATNVVLDQLNNGGTTKQNSIKLTSSTTKNVHLLSPKVTVDATKTYNFKAYTNVKTRTSGALAFYVDEYDAFGNWISGKYIYEKRNKGVQTISFAYKPTSSNVKNASIQVIVTKGSGITAYLDDAHFAAA